MKWLSVDTAAAYVGVDREEVLKLIEECELDSIVQDGEVLIEATSASDYKAHGRVGPGRRVMKQKGRWGR
ncbi:MAG: hypothetical protein KAX80_05415 [Planctomycetes bacterium]|nr:hypothetical protein [Planctomycetota bacterium]